MRGLKPIVFASLVLAALAAGCGGGGSEQPAESAAAPPDPQHTTLFKPLPAVMASPDNPITDAKVNLGRMLYYDTRLSKGDDISCNTCHLLDKFGVDGKPVSDGHDGQKGTRNSPTVYNAAAQFAQFWDGREPTVEAQAKGPILNPVEMAMASPEEALARIKKVPGYAAAFTMAFPKDKDPVNWDNLALAVGAFERKLVTPDRFDDYLRGDGAALTAEERAGLETYIEVGCTTCHMGTLLGGNMYQKIGLYKPYPTEDLGRYEVTGNEADKYMFKVPILRNVAMTAPYLHDGSIATLEESIRIMGEYQMTKPLTEEQIAGIVTYLGALTGEIPMEYIKEPALP